MISNKIQGWSISRYNEYQTCPKKAYFKFVLKMKEPGNKAMDRGTDLHKEAEQYLLNGGRVPARLKLIADPLKDLRKRGALAEANFIFKNDWSPTVWNDWDGAWCRVKADAIIPPIVDSKEPFVDVIDFKSGQLKEGYSEYSVQLELYGLAGLLAYPTASYAKASLLFIDHGKSVPLEDPIMRKDVKKLQKKWEMTVKPMLNDTKFKEKPGQACRWCHFRKDNGGPCRY